MLDKHFYCLHNATMPLVKINLFKRAGSSNIMLGFSSRLLIITLTLSIILISAIGFAMYFYFQFKQSQIQLSRSNEAENQASLLSEVGKLIVLPTGDQPTIATVSDISKLKGQPFFVNAKDGDKVLIYSKAKEAILFDPVSDKIVAVGPISFNQVKPTIGPTPTIGPFTVALYNGTTIIGYTATIAQELKGKMPNANIILRTNAQKSSYTSTIVVDQTGKNASAAGALASVLSGKVGSLPYGEQDDKSADLLVILGK